MSKLNIPMTAETTTPSRIMVEFTPPVARIRLQHPPVNVIDVAMMEELVTALTEIEGRNDLSTVVLTGAGKSFSVGVDVADHTPDKVEAMLAKFHAVVRALVATKKVTIAAVRGHCLGGGAELAMVCDIVYTADDAGWGFPEIKLGMLSAGGGYSTGGVGGAETCGRSDTDRADD